MTAKEWLNRARRADLEVRALVEARDAEREKVERVVQSLSGTVVSGTKDPHRFDRLAALECELDKMIDRMVDIKAEAVREIARVQNPMFRTVLILRYIKGMTFEEIAQEVGCSHRHACRIHGRALLKMEETWQRRS